MYMPKLPPPPRWFRWGFVLFGVLLGALTAESLASGRRLEASWEAALAIGCVVAAVIEFRRVHSRGG